MQTDFVRLRDLKSFTILTRFTCFTNFINRTNRTNLTNLTYLTYLTNLNDSIDLNQTPSSQNVCNPMTLSVTPGLYNVAVTCDFAGSSGQEARDIAREDDSHVDKTALDIQPTCSILQRPTCLRAAKPDASCRTNRRNCHR